MGLPEINIRFQTQATTMIQRSMRGVVGLILKSENNQGIHTFRSPEQPLENEWGSSNYDYIRLAFIGTPFKVVVFAIDPEDGINNALEKVKGKGINYVAIPEATSDESELLSTFIKSQRENKASTIKAVVANQRADNEGVINFTTGNIVVGDETYSAAEYCTRIAGIFAGLSLERSGTFYELLEIDSIEEKDDPDAAIDNGELILIDDGEKIKIGRAVNSFTSTTPAKHEEFQKIKIVEGVDMVRDDIRNTFQDEYIGRVINDYDNKMLFFAAVNAYFRQIARENVLDSNFDNYADIDFEAHQSYIAARGDDLDEYEDQQIRAVNTGSTVFGQASVKFVDAMEDLEFDVFM
ncbi:phage tail sheath subtilisin-like domain-containing protein [Geomicrobium sediminis]|uniref:Phage tail sheath protein n=1 Tax=Geomicrobium sediminis TaxID=1347788 RepID=A0ABS2P7Y4_9BACL|nr:phage tail sheath subtilisin-like domain-containing protein [Geomicrobium sediminis]MBM7631101.1 hypothetical protein [Geomicrobium sediminis]